MAALKLRNRSVIFLAVFWATAFLSAAVCCAAIEFTGVNLAGAEFGVSNNNVNLPGVYGTHYTYPTATEINYFVGKGMNTFRLPFRWERLQQSQNAALDATELSRMNTFVNAATAKGAYTIIDPHNFERYYPAANNFQSSSQGLVGSSVPDSAFADFWSKLADQYKSNNHVIFNLMNEPNSMSTTQLVTSENAAIAAIRATGATNLILVPGNAYTGAWSWTQSWYGTPNGTALLNIVDPGHNYALDMHQYLDDRSGGHDWITNDDPNRGVTELTAATQWMKSHGLRGFLGETAVSNASIGSGSFVSATDPGTTHAQVGDEAINNMFGYMEANSDVWMGWTWWAGGPWWTSYMFSPEPTNLGSANPTDKPLMAVIQPHFAHPVTGDYDGNGLVNLDDYTAWQTAFGQTGAGLAADGNLNGIVDAADYTIWRDHASLSGAGAFASGAVPEPNSLLLLTMAAVAIYLHSGRLR